VDDTDAYNKSYDIKTLERDIDVEDMFRWRKNGGDPLYSFGTSETDDEYIMFTHIVLDYVILCFL